VGPRAPFWRRENLLSLLGTEPQVIQPYSLVTVLTELSCVKVHETGCIQRQNNELQASVE
jgi:hypothetical protein